MTLSFPHQPDVKLGRAPLAQVVSQVRFSPILRIAAEQPVAFQEAIRHQFPIYEVEQPFSFQVPLAPGETPIPSLQRAPSVFRFKSADGLSLVTLAQDFFALSTERYTIWEDFAAHLDLISRSVMAEYRPSPILRVGLRYINEFNTGKYEVGSFDDLLELLQPELTSPITAGVWSMPKSFAAEMEIPDDEGTLAIRFGFPPDQPEAPRVLVLDFDYFEEGQSTLDGLVARCDRFHKVIYDAFRWAIRDDRLSVFDPLS